MKPLRRLSSSVLMSSVVLVVVGAPLWKFGLHPGQVAHRLYEAQTDERLVAHRELVLLGGWVIIWLLLAVGAARTVLLVGQLVALVLRSVTDLPGERTNQRVVRMLLIFTVGLVSTTKVVSHSATVAETASDDAQRSMPSGAPSALPALASAGLAVGLAAHIQRERAMLLRDSPVTARLRRPDSASLSRAVAVFERAQEWGRDAQGRCEPVANLVDQTALLVPIGCTDNQLVHLQILPGDKISVEAPVNDALTVFRHVVNTLILAPWLNSPQLVVCGFETSDVVVAHNVFFAPDPAAAVVQALSLKTGQPAHPVIVVSRTDAEEFESLSAAGIAIITTCGTASVAATTRVIREQRAWRITPHEQFFLPYGVTAQDTADFRTMVRELTTVAVDAKPALVNTDYSVLIRVLGAVEVLSTTGDEVAFRKSKSLELLCWLTLHRDRPTVSAARTALWEVNVADATFHNVLSELRRGLASHGLQRSVWRATKHRLAIDPHIGTDAELIRRALLNVDDTAIGDALPRLCAMLSLVRGLPFAGENYAWADAEGITSTFVWLVTRAVETAAQLAQESGDEAAFLEATAAGLRMMPGDEQFSALREAGIVMVSR